MEFFIHDILGILLQDPTGLIIPKGIEYSAIAGIIALLIYAYLKESKERIENEKEYKLEILKLVSDHREEMVKIQSEKDKLYLELSSNKKELKSILEKLEGF